MKISKLTKIVLCALFMAIICVATYIVQIPVPATGGYVNLGDCFVLTAGYILGGFYGAIAAGLGSALADILAGYMQYAPATFVIKAFMSVAAYFIYNAFKNSSAAQKFISKLIAFIAAEAVMVLGYFGYEALILGYGLAAAGSIVPNIIQGAVAIIAAVILSMAVDKIKFKSLK